MSFFLIFIFLILQIFTFIFAKAIFWQFSIHLSKYRKLIYILSYLISNGILVLTSLRIWQVMPRITANWLVLMLFVSFTMIIVVAINQLFKLCISNLVRQKILKLLAPLILLSIYAMAIYNAYTPVIRYTSIQIDKPLVKPVRIGMASDLHLGTLFGGKQLDKLSEMMNQEKVDIILLPGDIMDDDTIAYEAENMQSHFKQLKAPLGVYATLGNHDLFGHEQAITKAMEDAGIHVLTDEAVWIDNNFWVVGRPDELDRNRLATEKLLTKVNTEQPIFLMDHRPTSIVKHAQLPIDLQVSGHVHNGQIFPANLIVRFLNRLHYGYEKINQGHFFVTSGYGFWGVPLRLGSQSEIWIIDAKGK